MKNILFCLLFLLFFLKYSYSQEITTQKFFKSLSIEEIQNKIKTATNDTIKLSLIHGYSMLLKSKNDPVILADGYYFLSEVYSHSETAVAYADSIIQITKNLKNKMYPAQGYLQKGIQLYYVGKDKEALDYFLKANEYYIKQKDIFKKLVVRHYIGLLKNRVDEYEEAFQIFKKNMRFFKKEEMQKQHVKQYLKSLYALANGYSMKKISDSTEIYSAKGIKISLSTDEHYLYPHFLFSYGNAKKSQKQYKKAIDSTLKGISLIPNQKIEICAKFFDISEIYDSLNDTSNSIRYLEKIDSIYKKEPQVVFQVRKAYQVLLQKYQDDKNTNKQLSIIKKLLSVDSIVRMRSQGLNKNITKKYDTPELIIEKEKLITALKKEKESGTNTVWVLSFFSFLLLISIAYVVRKNLSNKKRFRLLIEKQVRDKPGHTIKSSKKTNEIKPSNLSNNLIDRILAGLDKFEKNKKFAERQYTLSSLAKELSTNNAYLSKVINAKKSTSFTQYMNNLRIDYAVEKLKEDSLLRSYTIKAIASEFGFNNAQSFTTAFQKRTGIYPSYFLKQLNKQAND